MPFQPGNKLQRARKIKPYRDALLMEIQAAGEDHRALRKIAKSQLDKAMNGDAKAAEHVADRIDGKVAQAIVGDSDEDPINLITKIERVIVDGSDVL